ncbi:MAG: DUF3828 domain-containing protein [Pyrinomonadaceae bacterium]|nr:DUF3828 domain-containing protein [Pyrinomonadaceae bacterium]
MRNNLLFPTILICLAAIGCSLADRFDNKPANTQSANTESDTNSTAPSPEIGADGQDRSGPVQALVSDLYKYHDTGRSPFFQTRDRALVDRFFTKPLAEMVWKDSMNAATEISAIDFDALYDAQDVEKKGFAVGSGEVSGDSATVVATFTNYGEKKRVTFLLKSSGGDWKIDDVKYQNGNSLMGLYRQTYGKSETKTNAPPVKNVTGEFEGTFRVGDTTCTVKPIRMAFEVRWAKGRGTEVFVFRDGNTFDSDDGNSFEFNDENYNSGTFYRADGKTFPVRRAN